MRILFISDVYFPRVNGVSASIKTFREELSALGHEVTLIAPDYGAGEKTPEENHIIRIPSRRIPFDPEDRLMNAGKIRCLLPRFRDAEFDLIHIQTPFVAHRTGIWLGRKLGLPMVETYHTYFEEYFQHYLPWLPKAWMKCLSRYISRRQCNSLDRVISPSSQMRDVLQNYAISTPIEIIPTGLQLTQFQNGNRTHFRERHLIDENRPVITCVSRVAFEKNIGFLLKVTRTLKQEIPNILFLIAGEGPAVRSLQKEAAHLRLSKNVQFVGYLDRNKELLDCYRASDCFVFASRTETQGLVLLEAMAMGTPVVSTAVMGTRSVLREGEGALIAEENVEQFAYRVKQVLTDPALSKSLSRSGREYVTRQWSAQTMSQRLLNLYQSAAAENPDTEIPYAVRTPE